MAGKAVPVKMSEQNEREYRSWRARFGELSVEEEARLREAFVVGMETCQQMVLHWATKMVTGEGLTHRLARRRC